MADEEEGKENEEGAEEEAPTAALHGLSQGLIVRSLRPFFWAGDLPISLPLQPPLLLVLLLVLLLLALALRMLGWREARGVRCGCSWEVYVIVLCAWASPPVVVLETGGGKERKIALVSVAERVEDWRVASGGYGGEKGGRKGDATTTHGQRSIGEWVI